MGNQLPVAVYLRHSYTERLSIKLGRGIQTSRIKKNWSDSINIQSALQGEKY